MTICPHAVRLIEDWAGSKALANGLRSTAAGGRGGAGFGLESSGRAEQSLKSRNGNGTAGGKVGGKRRDGIQTPAPPGEPDEPDSPAEANQHDNASYACIPQPKYMRANTQSLQQRRLKDLQRSIVPTNRSPVCVRVLPHETPVGADLSDPHSPMNIVNNSILPANYLR